MRFWGIMSLPCIPKSLSACTAARCCRRYLLPFPFNIACYWSQKRQLMTIIGLRTSDFPIQLRFNKLSPDDWSYHSAISTGFILLFYFKVFLCDLFLCRWRIKQAFPESIPIFISKNVWPEIAHSSSQRLLCWLEIHDLGWVLPLHIFAR